MITVYSVCWLSSTIDLLLFAWVERENMVITTATSRSKITEYNTTFFIVLPSTGQVRG